MMAKKNKRGRPREKTKIVYSPVDGTTILPYARKDTNGNYYFSWKDEEGVWRKRNLGRGDNWYQKYLQYEAEYIRKEPYVQLPEIAPPILTDDGFSEDVENVEEFEITINEDGDKNVTSIIPRFPLSVMVKWAKDLIHNDPKRASELFEVPYQRLIGLVDKKIYTLDEILRMYTGQEKFKYEMDKNEKHELQQVERSWARFIKTTKAKAVIDINKVAVNKYYNSVYAEFKKNDLSSAFLRSFFEKVIRVLRYAATQVDYPDDIIRAKEICSEILKVKEVKKKYPARSISKVEFHNIMEVSNVEEQAMWLISLNAAFYRGDIASVPKSAFDFNKKTVIYKRKKRSKKGDGDRAAMLWGNTIKAIRVYQKQYAHKGITLFFNMKDNKPYHPDTIGDKFLACCKKAGYSKGVREDKDYICHSNCRDSVESIGYAVPGIQNSVDAVMGHAPKGSRGDYVPPSRFPKIAKTCCDAVYDHYFGDRGK